MAGSPAVQVAALEAAKIGETGQINRPVVRHMQPLTKKRTA